jgi:hypothetical protein
MHSHKHNADLRLDGIKRSEIQKLIKPILARMVIARSQIPPVLKALDSKIKNNNRAWLEENRAKCEVAGFVFDPAIKRIEARDYWISR